MPTLKLTKTSIDGLSTSRKHGERFFDTEVKGFAVKVFPSGRKVFQVMARVSGRLREIKLGAFGVLTPAEARQKARSVLAEMAQGIDPGELRDQARKTPTFAKWVEEYLEHVATAKKAPELDQYYLGLAVKAFGQKRITDVTSSDIAKVRDRFIKEGKAVSANRFLASVRACMARAWRHPYQLIQDNPASHLRPGKDATPRDRVLTDEELGRLAAAIADIEDPHIRTAFVLLVETGARTSEALNARWADVNLDAGVWRLPETKAGKAQLVPLTPGLVVYLKALPRVGEYLFPGREEDTHLSRSGLSKAWVRLRNAANLADVHLHDLRRTFGLYIARKASLDIASKLLRHSSVRVTERAYAPFGLDDLRPALEDGGRVIPFMRKTRDSDGGS